MEKIAVIIAAAGTGSRMNSKEKKQYLKLLDKEILVWTIEKFQDHTSVDDIILVTSSDEIKRCEEIVDKNKFTKVKKIVEGGSRRQDSIYNGLKSLDKDTDIVMVHDGARPFVSKKIIDDNIEGVKETGGVITGVETKDTIKVVVDNTVKETLNRELLYNVQTPQTFDYIKLLDAYKYMEENDLTVTDDSSLAEAVGMVVKVVLGSYDNIKITTPDDLLIGELILKRG